MRAVNVTLREKKISKGRKSLYLDFYPPITNPNTGKASRREFLGLYIFEKPRSPFDKLHNKETRMTAEDIRTQRYIQIKNDTYSFQNDAKRQASFLDFFKKMRDNRYTSEGNYGNWNGSYKYLKAFFKSDLKMGEIDANKIEDFRDYLLSLDTLAQSGTNNNPYSNSQPNVIVNGKGTDCTDTRKLNGRAKRKMKTQYLTTVLADIANKKGDTNRAKAYWNAWHCYSKVFQKDDKLYGRYCKSRFCLVCLANRKADIINRYHPVLSQWEDPHFLTLTVKSVKAQYLNKWIEEGLIKGFKIIRERCKKRHQRGNAPKLMGVKSLECNYNPVKKTYNPHYHIIVPNRETAEILREEWMKQWTKKHTNIQAQHIRKVGDLERDLIEIIKYGSKIFTDPEMKKRPKSKFDVKIYAAALDCIFVAMKGHRLFDRFGFNLPQKEKAKKGGTQKIIVDYDVLDFESGINDWVNVDSGELLTGYKSDGLTEYLMKNNIDRESI